MINHKKIFLSAALAIAAAPCVFAGQLIYKEAAAPWSAEQAVKFPPAITTDFLKGVANEFGPKAAAGLSVKKEKVEALLKRFSTCDLTAEDVTTAGKYLNAAFRADVVYFAEQGCTAVKAASGKASAGPRSASLSGLEDISAAGNLSTYEGSARFFDGADGKGRAEVSATTLSYTRSSGPAVVAAAHAKPLSSNVPSLRSGNLPAAVKPVRPADLGNAGMVHQAIDYWNAMRENNWETVKHASGGSERAKALLKAAAAAGFEGLLIYSNLAQVETAGARLRWDIKHDSGSGAIAVDSAKLAFHSGVTLLTLLPIPMLKVAKAALAGEIWAIALMGAMSAGPVNRYALHVAD